MIRVHDEAVERQTEPAAEQRGAAEPSRASRDGRSARPPRRSRRRAAATREAEYAVLEEAPDERRVGVERELGLHGSRPVAEQARGALDRARATGWRSARSRSPGPGRAAAGCRSLRSARVRPRRTRRTPRGWRGRARAPCAGRCAARTRARSRGRRAPGSPSPARENESTMASTSVMNAQTHERRPPAQETRAHDVLEADHRGGHEVRAERVRVEEQALDALAVGVDEEVGARVVDDPRQHAECSRGERPRRCTSAPPRESTPFVRSTDVSQTASSTKKSVCSSNESAYGGVPRLGQREHRAQREERQRERRAGRHGRAEAQRPDEREQHADRRARRRPGVTGWMRPTESSTMPAHSTGSGRT